MELVDHWYVNSTWNANLWFLVLLEHNEYAHPDEYDCYSAADEAAWSRDEWGFVDVDVIPVYKGTRIKYRMASLGATDWGELPHVSIGREHFNASVLPPLFQEVLDNLAEKPLTLDDLSDEEREEYTESGLELVRAELTELYLAAKKLKEG